MATIDGKRVHDYIQFNETNTCLEFMRLTTRLTMPERVIGE